MPISCCIVFASHMYIYRKSFNFHILRSFFSFFLHFSQKTAETQNFRSLSPLQQNLPDTECPICFTHYPYLILYFQLLGSRPKFVFLNFSLCCSVVRGMPSPEFFVKFGTKTQQNLNICKLFISCF